MSGKLFLDAGADFFVPDGAAMDEALRRTTHLGIGAHQDDLEILGYSGIAECYQRPDRWFGGVVVTDGAGSARAGAYAGFSDEAMKEVRREEQRKAAHVGGYSILIQLNHPSALVKDSGRSEVVEELTTILRETRPVTVYLHNPADKHDTHVAVLVRCLQAMRNLPQDLRPQKVYGCEVWRSLDWLLDADKQALDASLYPNMAAALVNIFDSQISGGKRYDLATLGRRLANATFFESHALDGKNALIWAMDLTPLVEKPELSIADFTLDFLRRFQDDVEQRLKKFV